MICLFVCLHLCILASLLARLFSSLISPSHHRKAQVINSFVCFWLFLVVFGCFWEDRNNYMRFLQSLGLLPMSHQARETCNTNFESENLPSSCCSQSVDLDTGFQLLNGKKTKDLDRHLPWKQSKAFASLHDRPFLLGSGWVD